MQSATAEANDQLADWSSRARQVQDSADEAKDGLDSLRLSASAITVSVDGAEEVGEIGDAARNAEVALQSASASMTSNAQEISSGLIQVVDTYSQLVNVSATPIPDTVTPHVERTVEQLSRFRQAWETAYEDVRSTVDRMEAAQNAAPDGQNWARKVESNFNALGDEARDAVDNIASAFDRVGQAEAESIDKSKEFTAQLKAEWKKRVDAYNAAAAELDQAIEKQGEATEQLNAAMVKGTRSVIGAAKGFAELGLVNEETSEQMLKGLIVIQGAFDIFDGGADLLEAFTAGWKAVRKSTEAATAVQKVQLALSTPQMAATKAYAASLAQETAAANAAALANDRLGASRMGAASAAGKGAAASATSAIGMRQVQRPVRQVRLAVQQKLLVGSRFPVL